MRSLLRVLAGVLVAGLTAGQLSAQTTGSVTGLVADQSTRQPLPGVQVSVVGTNVATLTNQQGRFLLLNVPAGQRVIRVEVLGYNVEERAVTVSAGDPATLNIDLRVAAIGLDEVVVNAVTGRVERKRELGTNTATVTARDLENKPITKMADALTGRAAGVQLQGVAGTVGTSQKIRIRGANSISLSNEPLIYVDGVQFSNTRAGFAVGGQDYSRLNDLNPEDIANMEILKGPAASALYGTAAANGVILITTRRGQAGASRWRAYVETGSSSDENDYPVNYLPFQINNAAAERFTARGTLRSDTSVNSPHRFCPNYAVPNATAPHRTPSLAFGTCRQDENLQLNPFTTPGLNPFDTGSRRKFGMSVSGGTEAVTYYVSGDYDTEQGVISFNEQDRVNLRTNLGARVLENLGVNINAGYTRTSLALNANDNNVFSPLINALLATPVVPSDAQRAASPAGSRFGTGFGHYITDIAENLSLQTIDRFIIGGSTNYSPISWLALNANVGMDYFGRRDGNTVQPNRLPIAASYTAGFRQNQRASNYIWTANAASVASFQLAPSLGSTTTLGAGYTREQVETTYCYGSGIVEGTRSCAAASSLFDIDETYQEVRTIGAYLQQQMNWRDRLIVAASVRGDDNSAFGQDFGFILYPGASVSWVLSEEPFFPQLDFLTNLRLRGAIGTSGQRPGPRDAATLMEPVSVTSNNSEVSAVRLSRVGNPDLKPERTTEMEAGFDAALLDERLSLEFTYFQKESKDALVNKPLPPSYGLTGDAATTGSIWDNLGSIRNWGTELALNARVLNAPSVALNLRVSATTLRNEIDELGEGIQPIVFNRGNQQHKQGFSAGGFFARRYEIVAPDEDRPLRPTDLRMIDDSTIFIGPSLPTNSQSFSADLSLFRNLFTVSGLLERRAGHKQLNYTELFRCGTGYDRSLANTPLGNCSAAGDPNATNEDQARFLANRFGATYTNPATGTTSQVATSYGYIEDADFIKLRELALTVNAPQSLARRYSILQGASFTVAGRNLATWTDYTGLDPEINESGGTGGAATGGYTQGEFNTQPPLRYVTFRLNFSF